MSTTILDRFHPVVRSWFTRSFGEPSPPQAQGWPSIAAGEHTLIVAPTGSGKTLAAFLWCINHLVEENIADGRLPDEEPQPRRRKRKNRHNGVRVLYVSPLKALNNDIHRNLELPLSGILAEAEHSGFPMEEIRSAVRTGDTTQTERNRMLKDPPDILITTPESLYVMLSTERSRSLFRTVRFVIVDEIHAISSTKRGVHLSLTLERLEEIVRGSATDPVSEHRSFIRIGLSATQRPLEEVARFLGGAEWKDAALVPRPVTIIDAGYRKQADIRVICAARDFAEMPNDSIWSLIFPQLAELIRTHRTTLIFVNNRRLAERVAARLNEIAEGTADAMTNNYAVPFFDRKTFPAAAPVKNEFTVFAYHGSMSRAVREQLEGDLKAGRLRALITTSALELGIDIGTVDLVVQIQSPKGIARGLQRIGRSGHLVHANSKGRLFVTHREDLVECAVVAQGMSDHAIEATSIPHNCLDVLAQQIVAMVGLEAWEVDALFDLVRRSYCYGTLTEPVFHSVLEMLSGRYTTETFRELRARIVWNKLHGTLAPLPGSTLLALTNAGTIPDRGYFGVFLEDQKTKVGEVDEEFIYESRAGDTFILGSHVWRLTEINANSVIVAPAPGQPARMPFWRGEGIGRTYELGLRIGMFLEQLAAASPDARDSIVRSLPVDAHAVRNIIEYIEEQRAATGNVPTHTALVVEGFRDDVGDPRIVVHSCFGKGVNGLLGIVLTSVLRQRTGIDIQMLYNNDGILFRCSDAERLPLDLFRDLTLDAAQLLILEEIPSSPLFGALFRQNAERALLLPKGSPGKRRPFFLQRLKSADLLQIVRQYSDFPIVIETIRECLTDVLDFHHFKEVIAGIEAGRITVHTVQNETPSPFASTLLFDFAAVYMYQWDEPKQAERQHFAPLNRDLLADVVDLEAAHRVVRAEAVRRVEEQLQFTAATRRARTAEELLEILLRLGEITEPEIADRVVSMEVFRTLKERGIILPVLIAEQTFWITTEELPLYLPICTMNDTALHAVPEQFRSSAFSREEALRYLIRRSIRSRGMVTADFIAARFGIPPGECEMLLRHASATDQLVEGALINGDESVYWSFRPNLERIHRASLTLLRKEIVPATLSDVTRFFLEWQRKRPGSHGSTPEDFHSLLTMMQGLALPSELWEQEIFRPRMLPYDGSLLRHLMQRGEFFCIGTASGRSVWIGRGEGAIFLPPEQIDSEPRSSPERRIVEFLKENGASFLSDLRENTPYSLAALNRALSVLFWRGVVTNDAAEEVLNIRRYRDADPSGSGTPQRLPEERFEIVNPRRNPLKSAAMRSVRTALKEVPGWSGRWSLVRTKSILGPEVTERERAERQAQQLLLRYGIVAREIAKREENLLPWSILSMELQRMEMRGEIRRGYFVQGLSGMQFAMPEAVSMLERIKQEKSTQRTVTLLNACDPAQPYGSGIEMLLAQELDFRISRIAGNYVILDGGEAVAWIENFGARLFFRELNEPVLQGLRLFIDHLRTSFPQHQAITVEYCNGKRPSETDAAERLRTLGFYRDKVQTMRIELR